MRPGFQWQWQRRSAGFLNPRMRELAEHMENGMLETKRPSSLDAVCLTTELEQPVGLTARWRGLLVELSGMDRL